MMNDSEFLNKPWLLWVHDPCQEGGWGVSGFDTREAAIEAAKARHAQADVHFERMVEYCKKTEGRDPWLREDECYDGCMVTPGFVFRLDVEIQSEKKA